MNAPTLILIATITVFNMYSAMSDTNKYTKEWGGKTILPKQKLTLPVNLVPASPGLILEKDVWGGRAALNNTKPLPHPTKFVIIVHTATPTCANFQKCSLRVQSIQHYHIANLGSPDVGYNFLIGGDGCAYVGRGWDIKNFHGIDSISIAFIGHYSYDYLTPDMIDMAKKLLDKGVEMEKLSKDYKLIAHNQTIATESPGAHVYEVIKTWPHFDPTPYVSMTS